MQLQYEKVQMLNTVHGLLTLFVAGAFRIVPHAVGQGRGGDWF
jgi:hypothetical protein